MNTMLLRTRIGQFLLSSIVGLTIAHLVLDHDAGSAPAAPTQHQQVLLDGAGDHPIR